MLRYLDYIVQFQTSRDYGTRYYGVCLLSGLFNPSILIQLHKGLHITLDIRCFFLGSGINITLWNPWEMTLVPSQ